MSVGDSYQYHKNMSSHRTCHEISKGVEGKTPLSRPFQSFWNSSGDSTAACQMSNYFCTLAQWGWMIHVCVTKLASHWFWQWLVVCKPLSEPMLVYCQSSPWGHISVKVDIIQPFWLKKTSSIMPSTTWRPLCLGLNVLTTNLTGSRLCEIFRTRRHEFKWVQWPHYTSAGSRLAPSQWEASLQCNAVSHWLGVNL